MKLPKQLQRLWNKKLKDSGFRDIERESGMLKDFHGASFSKTRPEELEEKRKYFSLALELGWGYTDEWGNKIDVFKGKEKDRRIWLAHCEGLSEQDIAYKLGLHRNTISRVVTKYNKFIVRL